MQSTSVIIVVSVLLFVDQSAAQSCTTCRGTSCLDENKLHLECSEFLDALPFESQLMFNGVDENAEYGCLNLEYYVGKSTTNIQQCIISNNLKSYCDMIQETVRVKSCSVEVPGLLRVERDVTDETTESDSEADTEDSTDEEATTQSSSSAVHLVSIFSIIFLTSICLVKF